MPITTKEDFHNACDSAKMIQALAEAITPDTHIGILALTMALAAVMKEHAKPHATNQNLVDGISKSLMHLLEQFDQAAAEVEKRAADGDAEALALMAMRAASEAAMARGEPLSAEAEAKGDPLRRYLCVPGNESIN